MESLRPIEIRLFELVQAKTAFSRPLVALSLLARHPQVVRFSLAFCAEVSIALTASHSELGHVLGRLFSNLFAFVIFLVIVRL